MGNRYSTEIKLKSSVEKAIEKSCAVFDLLTWKYSQAGPDKIKAKTRLSAFGFGETIVISFKSKRMIVTSESIYPFTFFDLGKNQNNVEKFIEIFRKGKLPLEESDYAGEKRRSFLDRFFSGR